MRYAAKIDPWILLAVLVGTVVPLLSHVYWASGMVLGVLLAGAYPQSYETTGRGLRIRAGLTYRLVPYEAITFVGAAAGRARATVSRDRLKLQWGLASEMWITPANPEAFLADLAARAPHLSRLGVNLAVGAV